MALQILIATSYNTPCVERGYSFLQMVCAPRRNHLKLEHLETLFLLAALKLPVKKSWLWRRNQTSWEMTFKFFEKMEGNLSRRKLCFSCSSLGLNFDLYSERIFFGKKWVLDFTVSLSFGFVFLTYFRKTKLMDSLT